MTLHLRLAVLSLALIGTLAGFASGWIGVSGTSGPLAGLLIDRVGARR